MGLALFTSMYISCTAVVLYTVNPFLYNYGYDTACSLIVRLVYRLPASFDSKLPPVKRPVDFRSTSGCWGLRSGTEGVVWATGAYAAAGVLAACIIAQLCKSSFEISPRYRQIRPKGTLPWL